MENIKITILLKVRRMDMNIDELMASYPRVRSELPEAYKKIYNQYYEENRNGATKVTYFSEKLEHWLHKKVAKSAGKNTKTLEIGAGTLNQLNFERPQIYDIVEPYKELFSNSLNLKYVRNIYSDISEVQNEKYDRITAVASFEHINNLPEVVQRCTDLLSHDGKLCVAIPNEGRFLWHFSYMMTTGREFKKRFGLDYEVLMRYEHINTADEIEQILRYYFQNVKMSLFGMGKEFSFYRYYECTFPISK